MRIGDADAAPFKRWVVKRLEDISDADSDVLADYVLALVRSEDADEQARSNCIENLEDFLRDHTTSFVDDVFDAIRTNSYASVEAPQIDAQPLSPPTGLANGNQHPNIHDRSADDTRKRAWGDRADDEQNDGPDSRYGQSSGERATKQMRRGNRRGNTGLPSLGQQPQVFPQLPRGAIMAMQALGFPPLPGLPNSFGQIAPDLAFTAPGSPSSRKIGQRCRDYDTKGFCALGSACPYEHGIDPIIVPAEGQANYAPSNRHITLSTATGADGHVPEYDPRNASIDTERHTNGYADGRRHDRGRGGRGRGRGGRTHFSQAGPSSDRSITTVVVENIPDEMCTEETVRDFFADFGPIAQVEMHESKRLALVKYNDNASAQKAYNSPKVIFDNRFVKVYWYKPDQRIGVNGASSRQGSDGAKKGDEEMIDMEEVKRRQSAHEARQQKLKETEAQRAEVHAKIKAQEAERKKLLEKLSAKNSAPATDTTASADTCMPDVAAAKSPSPNDKKPATESLRLKLAQLEAEAESMGLAASDANPAYSYRGRGGGGGRGTFRARGGGWAGRGNRGGYRGSWRGSGGGAVKRLDFRSKRVVIKLVDGNEDWTSERDEALRSHLFNNFEFDSIEPCAEGGSKAMVVGFKERYMAENFIAQSHEIPSVGKVQLSWAPNRSQQQQQQKQTIQSQVPSKPEPASANGETVATAGLEPGSGGGGGGSGGSGGTAEEFDVADDEDRWMAA